MRKNKLLANTLLKWKLNEMQCNQSPTLNRFSFSRLFPSHFNRFTNVMVAAHQMQHLVRHTQFVWMAFAVNVCICTIAQFGKLNFRLCSTLSKTTVYFCRNLQSKWSQKSPRFATLKDLMAPLRQPELKRNHLFQRVVNFNHLIFVCLFSVFTSMMEHTKRRYILCGHSHPFHLNVCRLDGAFKTKSE